MKFQPTLNKTFYQKPPLPTHWQLEDFKLQKIKLGLLSFLPLVFNKRITIIRIEKQICILSSRETIPHRRISNLDLLTLGH